jgi:hypothetical protein
MMSRNDGDIGFGFDPRAFLNGLRQCDKGMDAMIGVAEGVAAGVSGAFAIVGTALGVVGGAIGGVINMAKGMVKGYLPEVEKTFGVAKDIIFKNFLWPLRKQMAPMLQGMLNWARDNRGMFIQWGQNIANLFKAAGTAAKILMGAIKPLFDKYLGGGKLDSAFNLFVAKAAAVAIFMARMLEPVIKTISGIIDRIGQSGIIKSFVELAGAVGMVAWEAFSGFLKGISGSSALSDVLGYVNQLLSAFKNLFASWTDQASGSTVATVFEKLADAASNLVAFWGRLGGALGTGLTSTLKGLMKPLDTVADAFRRIYSAVNGNTGFLGAVFEKLGQGIGTITMTGFSYLAMMLDIISTILVSLFELAGVVSDLATGNFSNIGKRFEGIGKNFADVFNRAIGSGADLVNQYGTLFGVAPANGTNPAGAANQPPQSIHDGIVQNGQPVQTDPADVIIAHKGTVQVNRGGARGRSTPIGPVSVNLYVTEGRN